VLRPWRRSMLPAPLQHTVGQRPIRRAHAAILANRLFQAVHHFVVQVFEVDSYGGWADIPAMCADGFHSIQTISSRHPSYSGGMQRKILLPLSDFSKKKTFKHVAEPWHVCMPGFGNLKALGCLAKT
jgi:hypothetical protein